MRGSRRMFAPRRRHRWRGVALVVVLLLAVVWGWTAASDGGGSPERIIADELDRDPDTPVLVPAELPAGYRLIGVGRKEQDPHGRTALATWLYGPTAAGAELPLVEVCVSRRGAELEDPCADARVEILASGSDGQKRGVAVSLDGDADRRTRRWEDVRLTSRWNRLAWVEDPRRAL